MRNKINIYPTLYRIILLIACILLVLIYNNSRAANTFNAKNTFEEKTIKNKVTLK